MFVLVVADALMSRGGFVQMGISMKSSCTWLCGRSSRDVDLRSSCRLGFFVFFDLGVCVGEYV
jgi:hypothetical protein